MRNNVNTLEIKSKTQNTCIVCGHDCAHGIDLSSYPITELYEDFSKPYNKHGLFDQRFSYCDDCDHGFLQSILDVGFIYQNYMTLSTGSCGAEKCLFNFHQYIQKHVEIDDFELVIDIGGNDSYFLNLLNETSATKINIDPNASGSDPIVIERRFFEDMGLARFKAEKKLIVSSHTIEHVENPNILISAIADTMGADDICFIQLPSLEGLVGDFRFDQICHQHLNYFSVNSVQRLLKNHGLTLTAYDYDFNHFGTLRIMTRKGCDEGMTLPHTKGTYGDIAQRYQIYRNYLEALGESLKMRQGTVSGFGAGLMVPTLAYSLPGMEGLKYLYDDNPDKIGKRFVNLNVEIRPTEEIDPDETILLASISTKLSARKITKVLLDKQIRNLVIPNITF